MKPAQRQRLLFDLHTRITSCQHLKTKAKTLGWVELLATRCQLAAIAAKHRHKLPDDAAVVADMRDTDIRLAVLQSIFALALQSVIQATDRCLKN